MNAADADVMQAKEEENSADSVDEARPRPGGAVHEIPPKPPRDDPALLGVSEDSCSQAEQERRDSLLLRLHEQMREQRQAFLQNLQCLHQQALQHSQEQASARDLLRYNFEEWHMRTGQTLGSLLSDQLGGIAFAVEAVPVPSPADLKTLNFEAIIPAAPIPAAIQVPWPSAEPDAKIHDVDEASDRSAQIGGHIAFAAEDMAAGSRWASGRLVVTNPLGRSSACSLAAPGVATTSTASIALPGAMWAHSAEGDMAALGMMGSCATSSYRRNSQRPTLKDDDRPPQETQKRFSDTENAKKERIKKLGLANSKSTIVRAATVKDLNLIRRLWPEVQRVVRGTHFNMSASAVLITYVFLLGIQVEVMSFSDDDNVRMGFKVIDVMFAIIFMVELLLRMATDGLTEFFTSKEDWSWNIIDFVTVICGVMELIISQILETTNVIRMVRVVRLLRMVRVVRVIRIARFFHSLRVLIWALIATLKSCIWTVLLLFVIMYTFGMIFAQSVHVYRLDYPELRDELCGAGFGSDLSMQNNLGCHFGSLSRSVFTLFKSVVGGLDWGEAAFVLSEVHFLLVALFVMYIMFVTMVVMNVVTGVFLQSALEQASQDHDHVIQQQLKCKAHYIENLTRLFHDLDTSKDGSITLDEFEERLGEEKMQAFLQTLEINASDAWTFFKLLDLDGGGSLDLAEFVEGCCRLKGNAKSIHMAQMMYENKWIMNKLTEICKVLQADDGDSIDTPPQLDFRRSRDPTIKGRISVNGEEVSQKGTNGTLSMNSQTFREIRSA